MTKKEKCKFLRSLGFKKSVDIFDRISYKISTFYGGRAGVYFLETELSEFKSKTDFVEHIIRQGYQSGQVDICNIRHYEPPII